MNNDKRYVKSNVKEIETQYGSLYSIKLNKDDIDTLPVDSYGNIKLTMMKRREVGRYGDTHYIIEDQYQPQNNSSGGKNTTDDILNDMSDESPF